MQQVNSLQLPELPKPQPFLPTKRAGNRRLDTPWDELIAMAHWHFFHRIAEFDSSGRAQ